MVNKKAALERLETNRRRGVNDWCLQHLEMRAAFVSIFDTDMRLALLAKGSRAVGLVERVRR
jgi:hypothetical protein